MTTYYYTPILSLNDISQKLSLGDNIYDLPYQEFKQLVKLLKEYRTHVDYLYEGDNFVIYSID